MHQCSHDVVPQTFKSKIVTHNSCESFWTCFIIIHINLLSLHSNWYWEIFLQSSCQIVQSLRSKNRQKGDQFFCKKKTKQNKTNKTTKCLISVKFKKLQPSLLVIKSYHRRCPLVNVWLIFDLQKHVNWLCLLFKDLYRFENGVSVRQFEHAILLLQWMCSILLTIITFILLQKLLWSAAIQSPH